MTIPDHPLLYGNTGSLDHMNKGNWMGKHSHPGICQCAKGWSFAKTFKNTLGQAWLQGNVFHTPKINIEPDCSFSAINLFFHVFSLLSITLHLKSWWFRFQMFLLFPGGNTGILKFQPWKSSHDQTQRIRWVFITTCDPKEGVLLGALPHGLLNDFKKWMVAKYLRIQGWILQEGTVCT